LRKYKACPACNYDERKKLICLFHNCEIIKTNQSGLCYECENFPCEKLEKLDKKHKEREEVSMIANLKYIQENGVQNFLQSEEEKWRCPECGGVVCIGALSIACSSCGLEIRKVHRPVRTRRK
jgi:hypothetical protein